MSAPNPSVLYAAIIADDYDLIQQLAEKRMYDVAHWLHAFELCPEKNQSVRGFIKKHIASATFLPNVDYTDGFRSLVAAIPAPTAVAEDIAPALGCLLNALCPMTKFLDPDGLQRQTEALARQMTEAFELQRIAQKRKSTSILAASSTSLKPAPAPASAIVEE